MTREGSNGSPRQRQQSTPAKRYLMPSTLFVFVLSALVGKQFNTLIVSHDLLYSHLPVDGDAFDTPSRMGEAKKTALVMRGMDPIKPYILNHIMELADIMQQNDFTNYDFHILLDQTRATKEGRNLTTKNSIQEFFRSNNKSHIEAPQVFGVTESSIRNEFPALDKGYIPGPLVDGSKGSCCGAPLMWQLLMPAFVTFVHHNQQYDFTWVFEDDVWTIGDLSLVELFRHWDDKLRGRQNVGLVGNKIQHGKIPYTKFMKGRHTEGFKNILTKMKANTHRQRFDAKVLEEMNLTRSKIWNYWDNITLPPWTCMSDIIYGHSREFSNFVYEMVSNNTYQFAECYQQPLAWAGGFNITDILALSEEDKGVVDFGHLYKKRNYSYALNILTEHKDNVSTLVYHDKDARPRGSKT